MMEWFEAWCRWTDERPWAIALDMVFIVALIIIYISLGWCES